MGPLFARATFRTSRAEVRWLAASFALCVLVIVWTKSGTFADQATDHLHHARATWTFLIRGLSAYRDPFEVSSQGIGYLQSGLTWEKYPVAYPPGMFAVFLLPGIAGRFASTSEDIFGKFILVYLTAIAHVTLWVFAKVFGRVGSHFWTAVLVLVWTFVCRITLLGFYDAAWLLAGAVGVDRMARKQYGPAVVCFLLAALTSYRAAAFGVLGAWAFIELMRSDAKRAHKLAYAAGAVVACGVVAWCFMMLMRHSPRDHHGVDSSLLPLTFLPYLFLSFGLGVGVLLAASVSIPLGATVALASVLSILHAGHQWHACLCVPALLALPLAKRRPLWAQLLLAFWFLFFVRFAFRYDPLILLDELLRFVERNGAWVPDRFRPCP